MNALIRHKAVLTTATAERLAQAGLAHARSNSMVVAVAVVDDGGAAIVLIRMDGANPAVADLALDKAHTSANTGAPTEAFGELMLSRPGLALGLSNRARLLTWGGGVPGRAARVPTMASMTIVRPSISALAASPDRVIAATAPHPQVPY